MKWKYFTLSEMTRSATAQTLHIDNTPPKDAIQNLDDLVSNLLDKLRQDWGSPIRVTSGYRCPLLNRLVGGVKNSQHIEGKAADIQPIGRKFEDFTAFLVEWLKDKAFDNCIIEKSGNTRWIHISFNAKNNRRKIFSIDK